MKDDNKKRQYRSNMGGQGVRMSIDESATAHIMDILSKMYANPLLACIREYSTNALDSHVEAGQTRPIEVNLPQALNPLLTVRDFGIGLDAEDIENIYSRYGTSTKRGTNSAQGMLGIGCKSALSYTDQFTLVGYKDGTRTQVVISRDEDGAGTMTIAAVDATTEPDGAQVTIPIKRDDVSETGTLAHDFFRFWGGGTVLIDGTEPRPIGSDEAEDGEGGEFHNIWLDDHTLLTNEVDESLVVMGYVAYPLVDGAEPLFDAPSAGRRYVRGRWEYGATYNAVCFVPIGDVNFAPSRESLMTSKRTKAKLAELRNHVAATFDKSIRSQITNAPDAKTAQGMLSNGLQLGFTNNPPATWKGREVLLELKRGKMVTDSQGNLLHMASNATEWDVADCLKHSYLHSSQYANRKQGERNGRLTLDGHAQRIFVGFDGKWLTNIKLAKLEQWFTNNDLTFAASVFVDKLTPDEKFWTDGWDVHDWADVDAIVLPNDGGPAGVRLQGSYDLVRDGKMEYEVPAHKIDTSKPLYYVHGGIYMAAHAEPIRTGAVSTTGATMVALAKNRIEKFKRDFPMAVEIHDAARAAAENWVKTIDSDAVKACHVQQSRAVHVLKALTPELGKFNDPTLNTLIRLSRTSADSYKKGLDKFGRYTDTKQADSVSKLIDSTTQRYPLAPWTAYGAPKGKTLEHTILYLNAAWNAEKGGT